MKKRGFTLIELLAVIVILAIIALIATPMILGVIESSKKGAFENSARGIIKAAESDFVQQQLTNSDLVYPYSYQLNESKLEYKGKKFISGTVLLEKEATTLMNATDGEYCANGTLTNLTITKGVCDVNTAAVYYEGLNFKNNTWDSSYLKPYLKFEMDGYPVDLTNSWFKVKNNRFELEIPDAVGVFEDPNYI